MAATFHLESTLTDRYQTTVPETVRKALKLSKRDRIHYTISATGEVTLTRAELNDDPALGEFLNFLASDITNHPERGKRRLHLNQPISIPVHSRRTVVKIFSITPLPSKPL